MHDALKYQLIEDFRCEVKEGRNKYVMHNKTITPMIFPQEYLELAQKTKKWEVIGFFEYQSMKPLKKASPFNYLLLRRI